MVGDECVVKYSDGSERTGEDDEVPRVCSDLGVETLLILEIGIGDLIEEREWFLGDFRQTSSSRALSHVVIDPRSVVVVGCGHI
jgi:hypothetical protein